MARPTTAGRCGDRAPRGSWARRATASGRRRTTATSSGQQQPPGVATESPVGQAGREEPGKGGRVVQRLQPGQPAFVGGRAAAVPQSAGRISQTRCWPRGLSAGLRGSPKQARGSRRWPGSTRTDAGPGAGVDAQLGGQGQLGAEQLAAGPPPPAGPRRPGRRGCRAGRRPGGPVRAAKSTTRGHQLGVGGQAARVGGSAGTRSDSRSSAPPLKITAPGPVQASMARATSVAAERRRRGGVAGQVQLADDEDPAPDGNARPSIRSGSATSVNVRLSHPSGRPPVPPAITCLKGHRCGPRSPSQPP